MKIGSEKSTLILGLGNLLLSDEGVGVHVVHLLNQMTLPSDMEVIDGGTGGFELLEHVKGKSKVIIVDCLNADAKPGSVVLMPLDEVLLHKSSPFSAHEGGALELLRGIQELQPSPQVTVVGIVPHVVNSLEMDLSSEVRSQLPKIISVVLDEAIKRREPISSEAR